MVVRALGPRKSTRDAGSADHLGAGDLGGDVADQGVAADVEDVVGPPGLRLAGGQPELDRQRLRARAHLGHIGVDPFDPGRDSVLRARRIGRPLPGHVAAIEEQPRGAVLGDIGRPEAGGEPTQAALAPQVDLPEPVAGGVVALQEEGVPRRARIDVRDPPVVDDDLRRRGEPRDGPGLVPGGGRELGVGV